MTHLENFEDAFFGRGIVPKVITDASSVTSRYYYGLRGVQLLFDESVMGYSGSEACYRNMSITGLNEGFLILGAPYIGAAVGSTAVISHRSGLVGNVPDHIVFMSSDLIAPELAESSSLNESRSHSDSDQQVEIDESIQALESLTQQMNRLVPLNRSSALTDLAKQAVAAMSERTGENVDEWARKLADDIKDAAD